MATNLKDLPNTDPEEKGDASNTSGHTKGAENTKPKRTRRSSHEVAALNAEAVAKGFKDYKAMERAEKKQVAKSQTQPSKAEVDAPESEEGKSDKPGIQSGRKTGITPGQSWNLGGTTYTVNEVHEDGRITFVPSLC